MNEINVIARNSTEAYKGKPADGRQIGRSSARTSAFAPPRSSSMRRLASTSGRSAGRAKTELDIAQRLNPGSFGILTYYLGLASTFGEPERGAELADRAIRLNPNYKPWASNPPRFAYLWPAATSMRSR